jgi:hypothetical protein
MKLRGFVTRRPYWRRFDDADVTVTFDIGFSDQFYIFDAVLSEMLSEMAHEFVLRYLLFLHILRIMRPSLTSSRGPRPLMCNAGNR